MNSKSCDRYIFIFYWIDAIYFLGLSFYLSLSGNSSFLNMNWSITLLIVLLLIEAFIVYLVVNNILAIEHVIKKLQESGSIRRKLKKKDMFF